MYREVISKVCICQLPKTKERKTEKERQTEREKKKRKIAQKQERKELPLSSTIFSYQLLLSFFWSSLLNLNICRNADLLPKKILSHYCYDYTGARQCFVFTCTYTYPFLLRTLKLLLLFFWSEIILQYRRRELLPDHTYVLKTIVPNMTLADRPYAIPFSNARKYFIPTMEHEILESSSMFTITMIMPLVSSLSAWTYLLYITTLRASTEIIRGIQNCA